MDAAVTVRFLRSVNSYHISHRLVVSEANFNGEKNTEEEHLWCNNHHKNNDMKLHKGAS